MGLFSAIFILTLLSQTAVPACLLAPSLAKLLHGKGVSGITFDTSGMFPEGFGKEIYDALKLTHRRILISTKAGWQKRLRIRLNSIDAERIEKYITHIETQLKKRFPNEADDIQLSWFSIAKVEGNPAFADSVPLPSESGDYFTTTLNLYGPDSAIPEGHTEIITGRQRAEKLGAQAGSTSDPPPDRSSLSLTLHFTRKSQ